MAYKDYNEITTKADGRCNSWELGMIRYKDLSVIIEKGNR